MGTKALLLLAACYFLMPCHAEVLLSTGFRLAKHEKKFYEGNIILSYNTDVFKVVDYLKNYTCSYDTDICNLHTHVTSIVTHALSSLNTTLPHIQESQLKQIRDTRGISAFSYPFKWCCNFAQTDDTEQLALRQQDLEKITEKLKDKLDEEHETAIINNQLLHNYSIDLKQIISAQITENELKLSEGMSEAQKKHEVIFDSISILAKLSYRLVLALNWFKTLQSCTAKKIPMILFENDQLRKDLYEVQNNLDKHDKRLALPITDFHAYSYIKTTKCFLSEQELLISISIPFISRDNHYELYSVRALPFLFNHTICSVRLEDNFVISKNGKEVLPLSKEGSHTCLLDGLCFAPSYSAYFHHDKYCLETALSGTSTISKIREACVITCSKQDLVKPIIIKTEEKQVGIIFPNKSITVQCEGSQDRIISTVGQVGITFIDIKCKCKIIVGRETIPPPFPCAKDISEEVSVTHHVLAVWADDDDQLLIHTRTHMKNITNLDGKWKQKIPIIDLISPTRAHFEPDFHQKNAHYFSYTTLVLVIGAIIAIIVVAWKGKAILTTLRSMIDPMSLIEQIIAIIFARPQVTSAAPIKEEHFCHDTLTHTIMEAVVIVLLFGILMTMVIILIKLLRSKLLTLFNNEFTHYDTGKLKFSAINSKDSSIPNKSIQHYFYRDDMTKGNDTKKCDQVSGNQLLNPAMRIELLSALRDRASIIEQQNGQS